MTTSEPQTPATDSQGHVLVSQWEKYVAAEKADKPKTQMDILNEIRTEAIQKGLSYDFYDAAKLYVEVGKSRNWKDRDALEKDFDEKVREFGDPLVTYVWMKDRGRGWEERWEYVKSLPDDALSARTEPFYSGMAHIGHYPMAYFLTSDREFVLWDIVKSRYMVGSIESTDTWQALKACVGDRYPTCDFMEYFKATRLSLDEEREAMKQLSGQFAGKPLGLYPREWLLKDELRDLQNENKGTEAQYKALYDKCKVFIKDRNAFTGEDALIVEDCDGAEDIIATLTSQDVGVSIVKGEITVVLRNLSSAKVTLRTIDSRKAVHKWTLKNQARSFYVCDTLKVTVPPLDDEIYEVEAVAGKQVASASYTQQTLSIATRSTESGEEVYVTDHLTGKPLENVKVSLYRDEKRVGTQVMSFTDGFNLLPASFRAIVDGSDSFHYLVATIPGANGKTRMSPSIQMVRSRMTINRRDFDGTYCNIYKDRGAYNPGDVVKFKIVLFRGNLVDKMAVLPGETLKVTLYNAESKEIDSKSLTTGEFGSVSGEFALPVGQRNGRFSIRVRRGSSTVASDSFRVDEFVLPTFTASFDDNNVLYVPGDTVHVSGKLQSFSGHTITDARISVNVQNWGRAFSTIETAPAEDGSFAFDFPARSAGRYSILMTVSDGTGETAEFSTGIFVVDKINVGVSVKNSIDGSFLEIDSEETASPVMRRRYRPLSRNIVDGDVLKVHLAVSNADGEEIPYDLTYVLQDLDKNDVLRGSAKSGDDLEMDISSCKSGLYTFIARAVYKYRSEKEEDEVVESKVALLVLRKGDTSLDAPLRRVFIPGEGTVPKGGDIHFRLGSADGEEWAVATLFDDRRNVLENKMLHLAGKQGKPGSLEDVTFSYKDSYPDAVRLVIFYFKDGEAVSFDQEYRRERTLLNLPLTFDRFEDKAYPSTSHTFTLKTDPGVEALVSVFDRSIDEIEYNHWPIVVLRDISTAWVGIESACGAVSGEDRFSDGDNVIAMGRAGSAGVRLSKASGEFVLMDAMAAPDNMVEEMASTSFSSADAGESSVPVRENFETALCFIPDLRSDADGNLSFTFDTSDKLSTFHVRVYAHDKDVRNALVEKDMVVSLPVKVAVVEPQYLYKGDKYSLAASVSSNTDVPVTGTLRLTVYPSGDYKNDQPLSVRDVRLTVPAGKSVSHVFEPIAPEGIDTAGLKVSFITDEYSDAVFVTLPVYDTAQTLTESHSSVLLAGDDREAVLRRLRGQFVNVPAAEAEMKEITILDMVKEVIPSHKDPSGDDVLSLSEAWYVRCVASSLTPGAEAPSQSDPVYEKIMSCRNSDGGFAWFPGMRSNPVITAVMLERFAKLGAKGFRVPDMSATVKYLDNNQFTSAKPYWCGWISDAQYMYIRSFYSSVPFAFNPASATEKKRLEEFGKSATSYLIPSEEDGRGLNGRILDKARRLRTLKNLYELQGGTALAKAWGVTTAKSSDIGASVQADVESLVEYAIDHRDGGKYFPNAVMPWRGLLETEAYAHSVLCDLFAASGENDLADGIRLWLMMQKETQKWEAEPAFIDAVNSVLSGSEAVLQTTVIVLSATYTKPFTKIKAAGNGFTLERRYFLEKDDSYKEIKAGDKVYVGDKIHAEYRIWNQENRSFVRLTAPREASLRPVRQLSGYYGWAMLPIRVEGLYSIVPQGYRNVKAERTEFFFDTFPEENTTVEEDFFVTQSGTFSAPVPEIVSLYADHYRANAGFSKPLVSERK